MTHGEFTVLVARMRAAQVRLFNDPLPLHVADMVALERQVDRYLQDLAQPLDVFELLGGQVLHEG